MARPPSEVGFLGLEKVRERIAMSLSLSKVEISDLVWMLHSRIIGAVPEFPEPPHRFTKDLITFLGWTTEGYRNCFIRRAEASRSLTSELISDPDKALDRASLIPEITHKIWVTSPDQPKFPPEQFIDRYCENISSFPAGWIHMLWVNNSQVGALVADRVRQSGGSVVVCNIDDLPQGLPLNTAKALIAARKYVSSTDVLRMMAVNAFGGIYSDFGIGYRTVVPGILKLHEYCLVFVHDLFFQSSVVGAAASSDLVSIFLAIISHPEALNRAYAIGSSSGGVEAIDEVEMLAGLGWTACVLLFLPERTLQAYVYAGGEIVWEGLRSWYDGGGKLGNVLIHQTEATVVKDSNFAIYEAKLRSKIMYESLHDLTLREKISILLKTEEYFLANPTRLCRLLKYYGYDLGIRQSMGYILNYLLWKFVDDQPKIVDMTLGSLSANPGGLAGAGGFWKEFFRGCSIHSQVGCSSTNEEFDVVLAGRGHFEDCMAIINPKDAGPIKKGGFLIVDDIDMMQAKRLSESASQYLSMVIIKFDYCGEERLALIVAV